MIYGSRQLPFGRKPRQVKVRFGNPMDFSRYAGLAGDRYVERSISDEITFEIMTLSGPKYVDVYGSMVKRMMDVSGASAGEVTRELLGDSGESSNRVDDDPEVPEGLAA